MERTKKRVNRGIALLITIVLLSTGNLSLLAAEEVQVKYNDVFIGFDSNYGFPFIDENNRTQVPFRLTMETFGASVSWNQETFTATAIKDGIRVDVPIGEQYILRNGEKILNDTTSRIVDDRTYLPIRVVLEAFDAKVSWDQTNFTVVVTYEDEQTQFTRIPSSYDLRDLDRTTSVKNQFDTGACWAFASYGAMESTLLPREYNDFSEDHLSLGHGFNLDQADGGNLAISLSYLTRWSGPVIEEDDIFNDGINNPNAKVVKHVQEAQFIPDKDYTGIKVALLTYGAVQTSVYLNPDSLDPSGLYYDDETSAYYYYGGAGVNHDLTIIGWDDRYSKTNFKTEPKKDGAFIVKNSYGTEFGDNGYFYISYEDIHVGKQNVVFTRIDGIYNYDSIYQTDWLGYIGHIGFGDETAYFANAYTTDGPESLEAVSFYATDENSTYEVYVVDEFTSKDDFDNMTMIKRGGFDLGGYYTVDFESPVPVNGKFSVVVRITTPKSQYPVAAEFYKDEPWLNGVVISDGEGYMSYDGKTWQRSEEVLNANICLKAFTSN